MKQAIFCIAFGMLAFAASAQPAFKKTDKLLNLGIGLGNPFWGSGYSASLSVNPTITFEAGVSNKISVGGTVSYSSSKLDLFDFKYNGIYIGGRGSYHFDISNKNIDVYAGAGLGYIIVSVSSKSAGTIGSAASGIGYTALGGGKYYIGKKTAVYAELGYGSFSILNAGISFKF